MKNNMSHKYFWSLLELFKDVTGVHFFETQHRAVGSLTMCTV